MTIRKLVLLPNQHRALKFPRRQTVNLNNQMVEYLSKNGALLSQQEGRMTKTSNFYVSPTHFLLRNRRIQNKKRKSFKTYPPFKKVNSFQEDVLPLKAFLDENDPGEYGACEMVIEFLSVVLQERPSAIVSLIRFIGRHSVWGSTSERIVRSIDDQYSKMYKARMDTVWLLGRS
mmetsp:Transcript_21944/g.40941  ORF Transcript_21944/g.40941 Transcript_21944/m.40941 type:complete len:174 (+) Transcript_21944:116-637(+)